MIDERLTRTPPDKDHPANFDPRALDLAAWEKRAAALRMQAKVALGLWPMPPRPPIDAMVHGAIERDDYVIENISYKSLPGHRVTGNLYRPRSHGPHPAVLHPHGHFEGGRFMWRTDEQVARELATGAERSAVAARAPLQAACATLARLGCVVFHYDMVGYGDSAGLSHREGFLDARAILHLQSFMGLQAWDGLRALDFLLQQPDVDASRVGLVGASSGATQLIALAALDERVTCTCPIVMVSMAMQGGCICENAPLYRIGTNNVELACLSAPRPQEAIAALDWTAEYERRGLPEMKAVYGLYGAPELVAGATLPFPHNFNVHSRERAYAFLARHLRIELNAPFVEPSFAPAVPDELSIYEANQRPAMEPSGAAAIREWMTSSSEIELIRLRTHDRHGYRQTIRIALRAMLATDVPDADDIEMFGGDGPLAITPGMTWRGFLRRVGSGECVACAVDVPGAWRGAVTVRAHRDRVPIAETDDERAVIAIDTFASNGRPTATEREARSPNPRYAGYWLGYVRSTVAERAHDLLTAIALGCRMSRSGRVRVTSEAGAAAWAVPAIALAGDVVESSSIADDGWDFDRATADDDPLLLPGALKYGGLRGLMDAFEYAPQVWPVVGTARE